MWTYTTKSSCLLCFIHPCFVIIFSNVTFIIPLMCAKFCRKKKQQQIFFKLFFTEMFSKLDSLILGKPNINIFYLHCCIFTWISWFLLPLSNLYLTPHFGLFFLNCLQLTLFPFHSRLYSFCFCATSFL